MPPLSSTEIGSKPTEEDRHFFLPDLRSVRSIFALVVATELMALVLVLFSGSLNPFDWEKLALNSLFMHWVVLSNAMILSLARVYLRRMGGRAAALLMYAIILLVTLVFSLLAHWTLPEPSTLMSDASADWLNIGKNLLIAAILGFFFLQFLLIQAELNQKQQSELEHRLQALQSRIRPHFLFNSMNSIASLIASDPEAAENVVLDLSELFRASLNEVGNSVHFKQELDLCKRYMNIEALRLGERMRLVWNIDSNSLQVRIPLLTLQPLLENAVYHGIQPLVNGGTIEVCAQVNAARMEVSVRNSLDAEATKNQAEHSARGNQMALDNIKHRLSVLHGEEGKIKQTQGDDYYHVSISFPVAAEASDSTG